MYSISQAVEEIVRARPYLSELLENELLNINSLARSIKPQVEELTMKRVTKEAVSMAVRRLPKITHSKELERIFHTSPDIVVRSNLCEISITKKSNPESDKKLANIPPHLRDYFFTITHGLFEETIILNAQYQEELLEWLKTEHIVATITNLVALTLRLDPTNVETPGVYYQILKALFIEHINVVEIVSAFTEVTFLVREQDAGRAFTVIKTLFSPA